MRYDIKGSGISESRSAKPAAVALADSLAKEHKTPVTVSTENGTVVHEAKVRKTQTRTPANTRVDARELAHLFGDGVKLPRGFEIAYARPRSAVVTLRKTTQANGTELLVFNLADGKSTEVGTTREAGQVMKAAKQELALVG